jgi:hypothetical protein
VPLRIDVSGILEDLGTEADPIMIERFGAPTINALGEPDHGTPTEIAASAVVHQATRRQLERAGLDLGPDYRAFYTRTELQSADGATAPDVVVYDGARWTIVNVADYSALGGLYLALGSRQL